MKNPKKIISLMFFTLLCVFNAQAKIDCNQSFTVYSSSETLVYKVRQVEFILDRYTTIILGNVGGSIKAKEKKEFYPVPTSAIDEYGFWSMPDLLSLYSSQFKAANSLICLSNAQINSGKLTEGEAKTVRDRLEYLDNLKKTSKTTVSRIIQRVKKDIGDFPSGKSDIDSIADEMFNSYDVLGVYDAMKPLFLFMTDRELSKSTSTDLHVLGHLMEHLAYYASYISTGSFKNMDASLMFYKAQSILEEHCPAKSK